MNKKLTVILSIVIVLSLAIIVIFSKATDDLKTKAAIAEQNEILDRITLVNDYTNEGDSISLFVSDLWLPADNKEHKDFCQKIGDHMDRIYCEHTGNNRGQVFMYVYLDNKDGTVTQLAEYYSGEVKLYYKH